MLRNLKGKKRIFLISLSVLLLLSVPIGGTGIVPEGFIEMDEFKKAISVEISHLEGKEIVEKTYQTTDGRAYKLYSYTESEQDADGVSLDVMADYLGVAEKELLQKTQLDQAQNDIYDWLLANKIENRGTYVDQYGNIVVNLKLKSSEVEKEINALSQLPVKFKYVQYSKDELKIYQQKLVKLAEEHDLGIFGVGTDTLSGKLTVDIKPEAYEKYKDFILDHIDEDLIDWNLNNLSMIEYTVSPRD